MIVLRATALAAADATVLVGLRPDGARLVRHLAHPAAWLRADVDAACIELCRAGLWLLAGWLAVGLLVTAASTGTGRLARAADAVRRSLFPNAARRLLAGALGMGVLLAPMAAGASPAPVPSRLPVSARSAPGWPVEPPAPLPGSSGPAWPQDAPAPVSHRPQRPAHAPPRPRATPRPHGQPQPKQPQAAPSPAHSDPAPPDRAVTVRPGDSLWLIAQRRLGPGATAAQVATAWPRWYAANRTTVGLDPGLIRPGLTLHEPAPTALRGPEEKP